MKILAAMRWMSVAAPALIAFSAAGAEPTLREDFSAGMAADILADRWEFSGAAWAVTGGALRVDAPVGRGVAVLAAAPVAGRFEASAVVRLEARGLIQRRPHPTDGRAMGLHPTPEGVALMQRAEQAASELELEKSKRLTNAQRKTLIDLLQKIYL